MDIHIIDNDESTRLLFTEFAQILSFSAKNFSSANAYLEYMNRGEYSPPRLAILSSVDMRPMSGYELMDIVRKANPEQRFVIVTGSPEIHPKNELACFYFVKPASLDKLKETFRALSTCVESGIDPDRIGCTSIDDRCAFSINGWHCPLRAT